MAKKDRIIDRSRLTTKVDYLSNAIVDLDIQLAATAGFKGLSEYQLLIDAITPILSASDLTLAEISDNVEQINFLAQETDTDAARVRLAAQAETLLFGVTELSGSNFLYALARENIGLSYGEITDYTEEVLFAKIGVAIEKNIIAIQSEDIIREFVERLLRLAAAMIVDSQADAPAAVQSFNRSLDISLKEPALKNTFINVQRNFETNADPVNFWLEALPKAGFAAEQIQALQLTNQLHLLIGGHTPLVEALQVNQAITSPLQLLDLSDEDWLTTIKVTGLPENSAGSSFEEKSQIFIANMRNVLHAAYPTQKIASMVRNGEIPTLNLNNDLLAFFDKATNFDFASTRVEDFEPIIQAVAPQQAERVRSSLQTLQRVFQISPSPEALTGLIEQGIDSAFQVAMIPEAAFVKTYAAKLGGDNVALSVHSRANYVVSRANDTLMTTYELTHGMAPAAINVGNREVKDSVKEAIKKHIPNYETLIGQTTICECRDCRSINSPAAYLVDVLRFLSKLPVNSQATTPLQVLSERRPDLMHLPLTCENTNTAIPYIDLVNEVLEYYVAYTHLDAKAAYDTGNATTQELRATPQNRVVDAYKKLAAAVYPCNLPYHQPLDTLRAFLPGSVKRADLMQRFNHNGVAVVAENLGRLWKT